MSRIRVRQFLGVSPKTDAHLLADGQAQIAQDCTLWSHGLQAIDGLVETAPTGKVGEIKTIRLYQDNWLAWTQEVDAVKGPIENDPLDRLYFTGTDVPRVTHKDLWNAGAPGTSVPPASFILGIPAPTQDPVASSGGAGSITADVAYVFTYVRKYSDNSIEESAPSPASNSLTLAAEKASVTLPEDAITWADYGITHKRLYRSDGGGAYLFVTEVAIGVTPVDDDATVDELGDAIESTLYLPPPDGMIGLIQLPNRCLAGFKDNVVYLSEPGKPHAYPLANRYVVNDDIVKIGNVDTSIVVATQSYPEIGRGVDPAAYSFKRKSGSFPCSSARSMKSGDLGVLWATPRGMAISDGAQVLLATGSFLTAKEWKKQFFPDTIHGVIHDGRYYGWFSNGVDGSGDKTGYGFVLDKAESAYLTQLSSYVEAAYNVPDTDNTYVAKKAGGVAVIYQFDADPSNPLTYTWKSKLYIGWRPENYAFARIVADYFAGLTQEEIADFNAEIAAIQAANDALTEDDGTVNGTEVNGGAGVLWGEVNGDGVTTYLPEELQAFIAGIVTFTYWGDRKTRLTRLVYSSDPFPMPAGSEPLQHEFQVQSALSIREISMAPSMEELLAD